MAGYWSWRQPPAVRLAAAVRGAGFAVAPLLDHLLGNFGLRSHRIDGHDVTTQLRLSEGGYT